MSGAYHLYLMPENSSEPSILLATMKGSPFWTEVWRLAQETYGESNVFYLYF